MLLVGQLAGWPALAEVAATVGVEFAKTTIIAHDRFQGSEGRGGALLGEEASVQDAAIGIVQRHHQILPWQACDPLVSGGVQMYQHAHHRPSLALAPILTPRRFFLYHSGFLQHQAQPIV